MGQTREDKVYRNKCSAINGKRVLQLRAQGKSWQEIAHDFGYLHTQAIKRAADRAKLLSV